jgi:hypothetical protein
VSGWFNRIGDVATTVVTNAGKFGGELLGAATAPARFAWDVATAPWNDNEQYNGFINTFKYAGAGATERIIKPLASAGGAIMKVPGVAGTVERITQINRDYIREPLTTFELVSGDLKSNRTQFEEVFDPRTWAKGYEAAQDISFGQATVYNLRSAYDPKFNIYDPREREAAFKKSGWGKWISGGLDLGIQFFGDVTLAGGKIAKTIKASELGVGALKNADAVAKAAEDITKAQGGEINRFTKVIDDFTNNDSTYALNHPMVKSSNNPGLLAHLLGDSVDKGETALILRSALGDPVAMDELTLQRNYITDALKTARGDLSAVDEWRLFSAPDGSGMIPFLNENAAVIQAARDNYASLAASDKYFSNLMELGKGGGTLKRTTGYIGQGVEDFIAKGRATKYYDKKVGNPRVEIFQPTPFHRLYQKISWSAQERPGGIVDFNDPDSYREIVANVNDLNRTLKLDGTESKRLLDTYIAAATPEARSVATINLESYAIRKLAEKYDIDEKIAEELYNNYSRARTSALKSIKDNGFMVDIDESIIKVPQFESQTADFLPIMDFRLMDSLLKQNASVLRKITAGSRHSIIHYADLFQDAFKAGALLRLGYTMRNGLDSQLRIAASVGAMTTLRHVGPGVKNLVNNTLAVPSRIVDRYAPKFEGMTLREVQQKSRGVINELSKLKKEISEVETSLSLRPDDLDLTGKLNTLKLLQDEKRAVYDKFADVLNAYKGAKPKERIGRGTFKLTGSDGQVYELNDAFGGPLGEMFRRIASSGNAFERLVDSNTDMYLRKLSSKGIGRIKPTDPGYFEQWAQTLRQQFGNSAVASRIAAGESLEDITEWLISSPKGRDLRVRLGLGADEAAEYVTKTSGFLDQYLPIQSGLRGKIKDVTAEDLRAAFKDPTELPIIHGHVLEENLLNVAKKSAKDFVNTAFKFLGTLPEDAWARNPLYIELYRREARRRLDIMTGLKKEKLTLDEQAELMAASHKIAIREMKGILFNIERKSNLAMLFKYLSPFFSAQENAVKTWMKLAAANPAIVNRGYQVWQAPNRAGLVTDFEGNEIPPGQTTGNDIIWVSLPKGITNLPGLQSLTEMGIPKQSLDVIFGGGLDVLYNKGSQTVFSDIFPVGPYVAIPASEVIKMKPSLEDSLKFVLPFGAYEAAWQGVTPAWLQRAITAQSGMDDPQFASTWQLIYNTEQLRAKRNGLPPVPKEKIDKMTKQYWNMRTVANLVMPFAPRFDTPYKFYLDKAREYRRLYGLEADARFLDDFPDFFAFTTRLSKNPTNIQSSQYAVERINKYPSLVSTLSELEPRLIGTIANNFENYEFSQAAYTYLKGKRIAPGSSQKFLSTVDPVDALKKTEAEKGWIIYNQVMDAIDNELQTRGLPSTQSKGAEDLAEIKSLVIRKLARKTDENGNPIRNPKTGQYEQTAWFDDYLDSDGSKTNRVVVGLSEIISDEKFMKDNGSNPTWKSVAAYLEIRQKIASELAMREVKSIDAKKNRDLRVIYDLVVNKLKNDDKMGFSYLYDRFLSQDLVFDKYLTPGVTK